MSGRVILDGQSLSAAALETRVARAATGLREAGIGPGDTVAWLLRNDIPILEVTLAAAKLGATVVPVNWHFTAEEVAYVLADSGAKTLVVHADLLAGIAGVLPAGLLVLVVPTPHAIAASYSIDPALCTTPAGLDSWPSWLEGFEALAEAAPGAAKRMLYTSGTTGHPKGVRRHASSPEQLASLQARASQIMGHRPGMRTVICGPAYHSAPYAYLNLAYACGADIVLQPRFDAQELLAMIERHAITGMFMAPIMFVRLLRLPDEVRGSYDLSSLEHVIHAAASCPPKVKRAMIDWWGPVIHEFYGSTESGMVTHCDTAQWLAHPGTVGQPVDTATIRIYRADGTQAETDEPGEIYSYCSDYANFTYHGDDAKRRAIERDGLITNGDVGYFDADGYLFICDRVRDMVISGGVNIYPAEIESVIIDYPGVRDCAVFGIPDDEYGETLAALIEPAASGRIVETDLLAYLARHLARYKIPRLIEFRADLPREDSGKIFKRKLRDPYWRDAGRQI